MKKDIYTCPNCHKKYDLARAVDKAKGREIYCPHCKSRLDIKNN